MLIHDLRHPIDRKALNLTIKAYRWHQNDLAYRKHLSVVQNKYLCLHCAL